MRTSNIEMHWYRRRPDKIDLRQYWSVRVMWTAANGKQQSATAHTCFVRMSDALRSVAVVDVVDDATLGTPYGESQRGAHDSE